MTLENAQMKTLKSQLRLRPSYNELIKEITKEEYENKHIRDVIDRNAYYFCDSPLGTVYDNNTVDLRQQHFQKMLVKPKTVEQFDIAKDDEMDDLKDEATEALVSTMDEAEEQHEQQTSYVSQSVRQQHFGDMNQRLQRMKQMDLSLGQDLANIFQGTQAFQDMANLNATVASSSSQSQEAVAKVIKPSKTKKAEANAKAKAKAPLEAITMDESETMAIESIRDDKRQERDAPEEMRPKAKSKTNKEEKKKMLKAIQHTPEIAQGATSSSSGIQPDKDKDDKTPEITKPKKTVQKDKTAPSRMNIQLLDEAFKEGLNKGKITKNEFSKYKDMFDKWKNNKTKKDDIKPIQSLYRELIYKK